MYDIISQQRTKNITYSEITVPGTIVIKTK
jgi:hypothetical protein